MTQQLSDKQLQKQAAIDCLRRRLTDDVRQRLGDVDERLRDYCDSVARDVSVVFEARLSVPAKREAA